MTISKLNAIEDNFRSAAKLINESRGTLLNEIEEATKIFIKAIESGNKIMICGNEGSAANSQHFAGELVGKLMDVPPSSGLGSSSSVAIAVIGLFNHMSIEKKMTKSQITELARSVEVEDMGIFGGRQDQYTVVYGGINLFEFMGKDFVKVSPIALDNSTFLELERNLVIAYIGKRGNSGAKHKYYPNNKIKSDKHLLEIKKLSYEACHALKKRDLIRLGVILDETWQLKKKVFKGSTTKNIDNLYKEALRAGAIGGRVAGTGGGGLTLFFIVKLAKSMR